MPHLHTLTLRLEQAIIDAYNAAHGVVRGSAETAGRRLDQAEANLAAAIGPDRRTRAELAARNMTTLDLAGGNFRAASYRSWFTGYVAHEYKMGGTPRPGVKVCQHNEWCNNSLGMWGARRAIMGRAVTPGRTIAKVILAHSCIDFHGSVRVRGFLADGCGAPIAGDYLDGGRDVQRTLTTDEVDRWMARPTSPWRLVTRTEAAAALVAAGYRMCTEPGHWHEFVPADGGGSDVWRPSRAADWHTEYGAKVAYVVRREPDDEQPPARLPNFIPL